MAVILAAVGLYGVMAYLVSRQSAEIGIRMAMGARAAPVEKLVLGGSLRLLALGLVIGLIGALLVTRLYARTGCTASNRLIPLLSLAPRYSSSWWAYWRRIGRPDEQRGWTRSRSCAWTDRLHMESSPAPGLSDVDRSADQPRIRGS
jgi:hypothetical protein